MVVPPLFFRAMVDAEWTTVNIAELRQRTVQRM